MHRLIVTLALPLICLAQTKPTEGSWARFQQLTPEATVRVRTTDGRDLRGSLDRVSSESIVINTRASRETGVQSELYSGSPTTVSRAGKIPAEQEEER